MTHTSTGNRFVTALLFTFVGPLIGSLSLLAYAFAQGAAANSFEWSSVPSGIIFFVTLGYIFGIGPAFVAGLIYASVPSALQRLVLAPLYGLVATWLAFAIIGLDNRAFAMFGQSAEMWITGGVAAFGCALIARLLGWTPKHDGGEPHGGTENAAN